MHVGNLVGNHAHELVTAGERGIHHIVVERLRRGVPRSVVSLREQPAVVAGAACAQLHSFDGGAAMAGRLDFGYHGYAEAVGMLDYGDILVLRDVSVCSAAFGKRVAVAGKYLRQECAVGTGCVAPARANLYQLGQRFNLEAPSLVIGEVEVEHIHTVKRHQVEHAVYLGCRHKVAGHVNHQATVFERGIILDHSRGQFLLAGAKEMLDSHSEARPHFFRRRDCHLAVADTYGVFFGIIERRRRFFKDNIAEIDHRAAAKMLHALERRYHIVVAGLAGAKLGIARIHGFSIRHHIDSACGIALRRSRDIGTLQAHRQHRAVGHNGVEAVGRIADIMERATGGDFDIERVVLRSRGKARAAHGIVARHDFHESVGRVSQLHGAGKLVECQTRQTAHVARQTYGLPVMAPCRIRLEVFHAPVGIERSLRISRIGLRAGMEGSRQ